MKTKLLLIALPVLAVILAAQQATYDQPYRPQFHFTPEINWTNDPNGLVFHDGEWHLFYQYNPLGDLWGHMSWGHAVSTDLLRWKHLDVALPEADGFMIYSGSAVVDKDNTSGFGRGGKTPLIAIYTSRTETDQHQSIAYSLDRGRTWTKYSGNPVIDIDEAAFRDPKVFWHVQTRKWVMAVVLANRRKVRFYASPNLKDWEHLSDFGPAGAHPVANWECPDLFELPIEGESGETKWIFQVDSGRGHPWLGSGCQYFVGEFDGKTFRNDNPPETSMWLDWGRDFYAAQSYSDVPAEDGRRIVIGWINNWMYAGKIPTSPWRGGQSIPREVKLRRFQEGLRLTQRPVSELESLRGEELHLVGVSVDDANREIARQKYGGDTLEIEAEIELGSADEVGFRVRQGQGQETLVGYTIDPAEVFVDRTKSGEAGFDETFAGRHSARLEAQDGQINLHILVDRSVVEVFAGDGRVAITDRIFPKPSSKGLSIYSKGGNARIVGLKMWKLGSVWK